MTLFGPKTEHLKEERKSEVSVKLLQFYYGKDKCWSDP